MKTDLKKVKQRILAGNFRQAAWWSKWTFGYYNENWYAGLFSQGASHKVCGEITPSYAILGNDDVERIKSLNPDMKLIFLIRNPIERAWSSSLYKYRTKADSMISLAPDDEIISELKSPAWVLRGDYERTLDTYRKHFDSSQILVCFYDAIKHDPEGLMSGLTTFLDIEPFEEDAINSQTRVNASPRHEMPNRVRDYLLETFEPMIGRIAERFGSYATTWDGIAGQDLTQSQGEYPTFRLPPVLHP